MAIPKKKVATPKKVIAPAKKRGRSAKPKFDILVDLAGADVSPKDVGKELSVLEALQQHTLYDLSSLPPLQRMLFIHLFHENGYLTLEGETIKPERINSGYYQVVTANHHNKLIGPVAPHQRNENDDATVIKMHCDTAIHIVKPDDAPHLLEKDGHHYIRVS